MSSPALSAAPRRRDSALWRKIVLERLHRVFAMILMLQLIQVFQSYWWSETYRIVYVSLAVYAVTELLFSRSWAARILLQLAGIALATAAFAPLHWYGWPERWRSWAEVGRFVGLHARQFHPYVELAAGVLLATHLIAVWASTKGRAIFLILATVVGLAGIDSFYPLVLWRNIAWCVLAGLGWLVVLHLRHLKERHYDSWDALAERPVELLLPALIVIGVMIALGMMMPRAPVLLEDPYTLWLKAQHKDVPGLAGDGGFLITGSSVSANSPGSSKSGYGRSDSQIGGGFLFDYSPVMEVTTTQRSYWRGETKAVYTGKGWTDLKGAETVPASVGAEKPLPLTPDPGDETDGYRKVEQTVKMIRKDKVPVLFGAGPISDVEEVDGAGGAKLFWNPEEWELRFQRPSPVASYTVESEVRELDEDRLRELPAIPADGKTSLDLAPYLQLPDSLPARVGELAKKVTEGADDDYDRLKMLETYLQTTYPYTNTPDTSKQHSKDIVDAFLFEIQEGYCDYYSTAFVVMARTLGLPARWVKGYATGVNPQDEEQARYGGAYTPDPDGAGTYTVRNADAHSWAEVYFEGYGWVPFEPTSGFSIPLPKPDNQPAQPDVPADTTPVDEPAAPAVAAANWQTPVAVSAGAAAVVLAAALLFFKRRRLAASWRQFRQRGTTPNQRIVREMERFVAAMQRRGLKRSRHETLRETFAGWGGRFGSLRPELEGALEQFEAARYGASGGDEAAYERFAQTVEKIRKAL